MVEDARWRRAASRMLSTLISAPEDGVAALVEPGGPSAEELVHARNLLILVAQALGEEAPERRPRLEFAARVLESPAEVPAPVDVSQSLKESGKPLPSYLRDGMPANPMIAPVPLASSSSPAPPPAASSTVDLSESGIDLDEVIALPFQTPALDPALETYAATVAELASNPSQRPRILAGRGFGTDEAFIDAARSWQQRFAADPKLREAFERTVASKRK